jgi:F420-non-reducing hydrogenase iron-sulfur subunit
MVLRDSGIDPRRFDLQWVSSAEAPRFARIVTEFTETIKALGPNRAIVKAETDHAKTESMAACS